MRYLSIVAIVVCLLFSSCRQDVTEIRGDVKRYIHRAGPDFQAAVAKMDYFIAHEINRAQSLPPDFERFLDWRKKEWWNLKEEFAYHIHYDWVIVEQLVKDVARYHGYQIENFPKMQEDVLGFFNSRVHESWKNLVMDVVIWVEFHTAERHEMFSWLKHQYQMMDWEINNLVTDINMFLQWRQNAYALQAEFKDFLSQEISLVDDFRQDVNRYRIINMVNAGNVIVDFKLFFIDSTAQEIPRLYDEVQRYVRRVPDDFHKMNNDLKNFATNNMTDFPKLYKRIASYKKHQAQTIKKALYRANKFFDFYEREYEPIKEDVKRWWRYNILEGRVLVDELKNFYNDEMKNSYELRAEMHRFNSYSKKEWHRLKEGWDRFTGKHKGTAYGDAAVPTSGDLSGGRIFNDTPIHEITHKGRR